MQQKHSLESREIPLTSPKDLPADMREQLIDALWESSTSVPIPRKAVAQLYVITELLENQTELSQDHRRKLLLVAQLAYARGFELLPAVKGMSLEELKMPIQSQAQKPDVDTSFEWNAPFAPASISDIKIYHGKERTIAIVSERSDNTSRSLTNGAESAILQAIKRFELNPNTLTWIQHEPKNVHGYENAEEYSIVNFNWNYQENRFENPQWSHLSIEKLNEILYEI